ncbi:hypothetical protein OUZ56_007929 [Daphnia magna]|uniref:Uncharacterized protein n=1 Tax=Daphnia magna TaxID=35525 RepID=A0ABR0ABF4_9CRUS|nr:hypothetical protein OUZ56_007929 [Daphnia magna]
MRQLSRGRSHSSEHKRNEKEKKPPPPRRTPVKRGFVSGWPVAKERGYWFRSPPACSAASIGQFEGRI